MQTLKRHFVLCIAPFRRDPLASRLELAYDYPLDGELNIFNAIKAPNSWGTFGKRTKRRRDEDRRMFQDYTKQEDALT